VSEARVSASSVSDSRRAVIFTICARTLRIRRVSASSCSCRSWIETCWETIVPSAERRVTASCTFATGIRSVSIALALSPVLTFAVRTCPPSDRVRSSASCAARETRSEPVTRTESVASIF
jgi:hypothetical protein